MLSLVNWANLQNEILLSVMMNGPTLWIVSLIIFFSVVNVTVARLDWYLETNVVNLAVGITQMMAVARVIHATQS